MQLPRSLLIGSIFSLALMAGDPFIGTWRLDVDKSNVAGAVKDGITTYDSLSDGYLYDAKIVFENSKVGHLHGPVQFDGTVTTAELDGRAVDFISERIDDNSYKLVIIDEETGATTNIFRYVVRGDMLTFTWLDGNEHPELVLVYEREKQAALAPRSF